MNIWGNPERLKSLEELRLNKKGIGRLTFDCFNLKSIGERAYCSKRKRIGQAADGSMSLIAVLRGKTSGVCRNCKDFTTDEAEL